MAVARQASPGHVRPHLRRTSSATVSNAVAKDTHKNEGTLLEKARSLAARVSSKNVACAQVFSFFPVVSGSFVSPASCVCVLWWWMCSDDSEDVCFHLLWC